MAVYKKRPEFGPESITDSPPPLVSEEERTISEFASASTPTPDCPWKELYERLDKIIALLEDIKHNTTPLSIVVAGSEEWESGSPDWPVPFKYSPPLTPYTMPDTSGAVI